MTGLNRWNRARLSRTWSFSTAAAPQYTITIRDWKTDTQASADAFTFKPPANAKKGDFAALSDIDEVPPGIVKGEMK